MSAVNVVATVVAKKGCEGQVEKCLLGLVEPSRKDGGCLQYDLHRDLDTPGVFVFYEAWESRARLDEHLNTPHLLAWREQAPALIESLDVKVLGKF